MEIYELKNVNVPFFKDKSDLEILDLSSTFSKLFR